MKHFLRYTLFLCSLVFFTSCQDVDSLVAAIAENDLLTCERVGFAGSKSDQYQRFLHLRTIASPEELTALLEHENDVVAGYAAYTILDRDLIPPSRLFKITLVQNRSVSTMCGCILSGAAVYDLLYSRYRNRHLEFPDSAKTEYGVLKDNQELLQMDSLILYSDSVYWLPRKYALENRVYPPHFNERIQYLAFERQDYYAMEYVFQHLRVGNEEQLMNALEVFAATKENGVDQKANARRMLSTLNKEEYESTIQ